MSAKLNTSDDSGSSEKGELRRWLRIIARTVHVAGVVGLVGGLLFSVPAPRLVLWLALTALTGTVLLATDLLRARPYFPELHAQLVLAKFAILGIAALVPTWRVELLFAAIGISGVVSHMPGRFRHYRLFGGRADRRLSR